MRDIETIDTKLRLVAVLRRAARERGGPLPSIAAEDALLDERLRAGRHLSLNIQVLVVIALNGVSVLGGWQALLPFRPASESPWHGRTNEGIMRAMGHDGSAGASQVAQAVEFIRALREHLLKMTRQLMGIERRAFER